MKARGLRNNNPGNLDHRDSVKWNGELPFDADIEPRFCRFESPVFGIRALCKVLLTYQRKYKVCTIAGIVLRWAPAVENNTKAYIESVAKACGIKSDQTILIESYLEPLAKAIIHHENGSQPYPDETIRAAVKLALGK